MNAQQPKEEEFCVKLSLQKFNPASHHLDVTVHASVTSSNGGFLMKTSDEILRGFIPSLLTFASHSIRSKRTGFHGAPSRITGAANTPPTEPLTHPCDQNTRLSLLRTLQFLVTRNANNTPKPQCKTRLRNTPPLVTPNSPFQTSLH